MNNQTVVTRFAPSPTGYLHIGGARTALFSWLWARHNNGKFILRIEDTDTKRNTPTATQQVIDDLKWLGIDWDEGPEVNGPNGPYLQSQRRDIYDKYMQQLLDAGHAYYCLDTPEDVQKLRDEAAKQKINFIYKAPEVFPDAKAVEAARAQGKPVTIRLVMPQEEITVTDIIRGQVKFKAGEFGDFIIQKSDGFPTYHFACVVDDELMGITDIIRGQEHLMNTPCHIALQKALGFKTPNYAHMSVTISQSGGKLSKRERPKTLRNAIKNIPDANLNQIAEAGNISTDELNDFLNEKATPEMPAIDAMAKYLNVHLPEINVVDFLNNGYLPQTMVNFVALLGWNPGTDKEIMTLDELISSFDITRLAKSNSLFDRKKLASFNTEHIKILSPCKLLKHLKDYLATTDSPVKSADDQLLIKLINACAGARTLEEINKKCKFLFVEDDKIKYDQKAIEKVLLKSENQGLKMLDILKEKIDTLDELTAESVEDMLRTLAEVKSLGLGKVAQPLRVAITGTTISPPIFDSINLLGKEKTLTRIDNTIKKFGE